jgi:hypothetical protein
MLCVSCRGHVREMSRRRRARPPVYDRQDRNKIVLPIKPVDDDHPPPGSEEEAPRREGSAELVTKLWEVRQRPDRAFDALNRVLGQAMSSHQSCRSRAAAWVTTTRAIDAYSSSNSVMLPAPTSASAFASRSERPGIPSSISVIERESGSASSIAAARSERASVPSATRTRSARRASFSACCSSRDTLRRRVLMTKVLHRSAHFVYPFAERFLTTHARTPRAGCRRARRTMPCRWISRVWLQLREEGAELCVR